MTSGRIRQYGPYKGFFDVVPDTLKVTFYYWYGTRKTVQASTVRAWNSRTPRAGNAVGQRGSVFVRLDVSLPPGASDSVLRSRVRDLRHTMDQFSQTLAANGEAIPAQDTVSVVKTLLGLAAGVAVASANGADAEGLVEAMNNGADLFTEPTNAGAQAVKAQYIAALSRSPGLNGPDLQNALQQAANRPSAPSPRAAIGGTAKPSVAPPPASAATPSPATRTPSATGRNAVTCTGDPVDFGGTTIYRLALTQIKGRSIVGSYRYEAHPTGHPMVQLRPDGTGFFEMWGQSSAGGPGTEVPARWWVGANCDGSPLVLDSGPGGVRYLLVMQWTETRVGGAYPAGGFNFSNLDIANNGRMVIRGERVKQ